MRGVEEELVMGQANLDANRFRFVPGTESAKANFTPVQLDLTSFISEIKKNSIYFSNQPTQSGVLHLIFNFPAPQHPRGLGDVQVDLAVEPMNQQVGHFPLIDKSSLKGSDIYMAYPTKGFCRICRESFQSYLNHVSSRNHINKENTRNFKFKDGPASFEMAFDQLVKEINRDSGMRKPGRGAIAKNAVRVAFPDPDDLFPAKQPCETIRKIRRLQNGEEVGISSFQSTGLTHEANFGRRKGSFFNI